MYASRGHRSSTTPMDFEYTNRVGPVDPASPFMNIASQSAKKREHPPNTCAHRGDTLARAPPLTARPLSGQPGPHSVLDSPSKNVFATPNHPQLREPDNRPFYFSQESTKPLPSIPAHVQNAWEPRTPASTYDFSSGGETPNTPQVDSDAATPDTQLADKMGRLTNGESRSPTKPPSRQGSWLKRFMSSPSPTKESREREKADSTKHYSHKAEHRIQKRRSERSERSRSKKKASVRDGDVDDSDIDQSMARTATAQPPGQPTKTYVTSIAGFFHWLEAHPSLPSVLSYYLQLAINICLAGGFLYVIWAVWSALMSDVDVQADKHISEIMVEIANCLRHYQENRCEPGSMAPALEEVCGYWETCMKRDPRKVARASVTARTFAKIFNDFVETISYKAMIFGVILFFGGFNISNWAFGLIRSQQRQHHSQDPNDFVPQTPHRVASNSYIDYNQQSYGQNWQQDQSFQTPYGSMRHIDAPPLVHTQSMPALALPSVAQEGVGVVDDRKTPRKRGFFR